MSQVRLALRRFYGRTMPLRYQLILQNLYKSIFLSHRPVVVEDVETRLPITPDQIGDLLQALVETDQHRQYFEVWQAKGFHVTANHFYQPIPDTSNLPVSLWQQKSALNGINMNAEQQLQLLREAFSNFYEEYRQFPKQKTKDPTKFYFNNGAFGGTDALVLYCMVRHFKPNLVVEVGSGYSTLVTLEAARINENTRLVCVDPYPAPFLEPRRLGIQELHPHKVQDVNLDVFRRLESGDILFIDTSHVVKIGSDVNYLFLNVLPLLKPGVIVHIHDIFFPNDYPREWVIDQKIFWNEQYLLQAFLMYNSAFDVLFCNSYAAAHFMDDFKRVFPNSPWWGGGSFWMQRRGTPDIF